LVNGFPSSDSGITYKRQNINNNYEIIVGTLAAYMCIIRYIIFLLTAKKQYSRSLLINAGICLHNKLDT
jgi:hypothetical protein